MVYQLFFSFSFLENLVIMATKVPLAILGAPWEDNFRVYRYPSPTFYFFGDVPVYL